MTQEFHISVTPVGQNDYLVRTEQVAPGVPLAEELVTWPVADWLTAAGHLMNDPLKLVLQGDAIARNSVNLVALGQQFYNALFQGTLRDSWMTAQGIAQNRQQVLRLRLGLKDTRLARLPWEVMHAGDRPVATGPYIAFSRYQSGIGGTSRLPSAMSMPLEEDGIKVLMVIASPTDQVRLHLLAEEAEKLRDLLNIQSPHGTGIELSVLEQPGREELTQALEQGRYHVLHYSGHSNVGPNGGEIYLVSSRTGLTETLTGDDLAGLLVNNNIQMAVFNSCLGAYAATSDENEETGERNLTESLVKRGIRSVLAMSERIPDQVALTLTQFFYHNLSQGYPVDMCVSRVRQGLITTYGSHQMYWALPILYLHPEFDGFLNPGVYLPESTQPYSEYNSTLTTTPARYPATADDTNMPLPIDDMMASGMTQVSSESDWLGEDTWGDLVDEIEYDDPSYAEDSAFVSDLFSQLGSPKVPNEQTSMTAELVNQDREDNLHNTEDMVSLWSQFPPDAESKQIGPAQDELAVDDSFGIDWQSTLPSSTEITLSRKAASKRRARRQFWSKVGVVGVSAIAVVVGLNWWWQNQRVSRRSDIPVVSTESPPGQNTPQINLKTDATGIITAYASEKLSSGDLQNGLLAVEELLNRNALPNAKVALDFVLQQHLSDPLVNFLRGRLAWQAVQTGDKTFSIDDARRYWENAAKAKPDSLLYSNALGFAYYVEGNLNRANDSWFKALNSAVRQHNLSANSAGLPKPKEVTQDTLTAYAGLAIGLYKSSHHQPNAKREQYLNEAIKLRQMVIKDDPVNFQMDQLANNWLWPEEAIKDWKSLLQVNREVN
ncbi:MAG: CHAT domain-containing protein [Fischerella sp.]|uniref:cell division protein HetF n=1 Tax=Fischerella sp. TaxID=1191 RepID=UPI001838BF24|nr:cell division protein HetF [Fischerella sp.]NWF60314.1 CHAT domain-containing protein [Fischerella sp.]